MLFLPLLTVALGYVQPVDRTVFERGEVLRIPVSQSGACSVGGLLNKDVDANGTYVVDTALLAPGSYELKVGGQAVMIQLVDKPNPDRYPLWKWGGTAPKSFKYFADRGFTGVSSPMVSGPPEAGSKQTADIKLSLNEATRFGLDYGIYLNPLMDPRWKTLPDVQAEKYDGSKIAKPYPRNPDVLAWVKATAEGVASTFSGYPSWRHSLLGSEFQLDYDFGSLAVQLGKAEANVDVRTGAIIKQPAANLPQGGLIQDDNPRYQFLKWWFHQGMGDAASNKAMSDALKLSKPGLFTWHDPYRLAPVFGAASGLDALSTWTYVQPDMTRLLSVRVLQAAARGDGQKVMQTVTLFLYPQFVQAVQGATGSLENDRPNGNDYYTAGPDFAKEALWVAFSQRPDVLGIYYGGTLQPDDPNVDKGRASPETFDAIGSVAKSLIEPYGATILKGQPERARVAVLMSAASIWLGDQPKNPGYPTEQVLPYCSLLAMNHVPFDILLDDDVAGGKLSSYDCLVMPQAGALTRKMYEKILEFAQAGKRVIADRSLAAPVPGAIKTDYDFSFQRMVDGVELAKGMAVTADESRARMEAFAADLGLKVAAYRGTAWADSPRAIVNSVDCGQIRYVFVVNDNRTFGPRFGNAKLNLDQGVQLSTSVDFGMGVAYDVVDGKKLPGTKAQVTLPASEGKLFAVASRPIGATSLSVPTQFNPGTTSLFGISVQDADGMTIPVRLKILDSTGLTRLSRSVAAVDGRASVPFIPALNDPTGTWTVTVQNLVTRQEDTKTFIR